MRRALLPLLAVVAAVSLPAAAGAAARPYADADYFAFADRIVAALDGTWDPVAGYYQAGTRNLDSRFNAALLTVHATAAANGWHGSARNDARARRLAERLTEAPPFWTGASAPWPDRMFHSPGWVGNMSGPYTVMDKAIDPKIAEGLQAAWQAREALGLTPEVSARIADEISAVAHATFFRFPQVRLNQINWPAELYAYEATVTGDPDLLLSDYPAQVRRFVAGVRRPWGGSPRTSATNLSRTYRFHYQVNEPAGARRNLDSAEYANMTLHFLAFHAQARAAGMPPLPAADLRVLRGWVQRDLFGYWMHSGFMNWDTGLGFRRWMKGKTWAYALQGLQTIATTPEFHDDPRYGPWAKTLFDRALDFYDRLRPPGGIADSALFGIEGPAAPLPDTRMFAARMAATATHAVSAGLGRMTASEPPPYFAYDPDVGRLVVSTPRYGTAVIVVNRAAFPYGGTELARLFDGSGDPVGGLGGHAPAAFGLEVRRRGRAIVTQQGMHATPARPPLSVHTGRGRIARRPGQARSALAGPFRTLEAVGRRRTGDLTLQTRHRFGPESIEEQWTVRRRSGHRRYSVGVLFPSWGRQASIVAQLRNGVLVPLAWQGVPVAGLPLQRVKRFHVRSERGSYWVTPLGRVRGRAAAVAVAPQRSAPAAGPTLRLTVRHGTRFRRASLRARITPVG